MANILLFKIYLYMTTQKRMIILDLMSYHAAQNIFYLLKHKQSSSLHDVIHERPQYSTSCSYSAVSSLLSILLASLEPLTEATLHAVHSALYCGAPALSATQVTHLALLSSRCYLSAGAGSAVPLGRARGHQERRLSHVHPSHTQVSLSLI